MSKRLTRIALLLSAGVALLAALASAGGLWLPGLYRDNAFVRSGWVGNDLVTLLVAVPCLVTALILAARGSVRARLVWLGLLDYTLYNYAFYLFGAAFNWFFFVYVALLGLSIYALILGLISTDVQRIAHHVSANAPVRWVAGFMVFVALGLSGVYVLQWLDFASTGVVPLIVAKTAHPTNVVFALDLTLVVPLMVLAASWLWQRRPWGYVLAVIANVKGATYMLALSAATLAAFRSGTIPAASELGLWATIGFASLAASTVLLWKLGPVASMSAGAGAAARAKA